MPHIPYTKPDIPNIASRLPASLQKPGGTALQAIFDLMGGDDPVSAAMPMSSVVSGPSRELMGALSPLLKGSLKRGIEIAPEVMQGLPAAPTGRASKVVQEFFNLLHENPSGPDPMKVLAGEKVNFRPPIGAQPSVEGFKFPTAMPPKREPLVQELLDRFQTFDEASPSYTVRGFTKGGQLSGKRNKNIMSNQNERPALSGKSVRKKVEGPWR